MKRDVAVEVRCRFDGRWVRGFEIAEIVGESPEPRLRVRRVSDRSVLPVDFSVEEVQLDRASGGYLDRGKARHAG